MCRGNQNLGANEESTGSMAAKAVNSLDFEGYLVALITTPVCQP